VPELTEPDDFNEDLPRHWTPAAQEKFLEAMATGRTPRAWYCKAPGRTCDGHPHGAYTYEHARTDQWPPDMADPDWSVWLMAGGRGSGKTRAGSEWVRHMTRYTGRLAIVAPTAADLRDTMIEGDSGIMEVCANAGYRPNWEPSKRRLTFPNGAIAIGYTAEEPDRLRGRNDGAAWVDEAAHYPNVQYVWDMLVYGLRMGTNPRICVTTTPTPTDWLRELIADERTRVSKVSTFANEANLAPAFIAQMRAKYAGTRMGRQELFAELLEDTEGALWSGELIDATRAKVSPQLVRVAVGVDPAGTSAARSDETGIVVVGLGYDGHLYVLADYSGRYTPTEWAGNAYAAAADYHADIIVAETNYGGQMVKTVLDTTDRPPTLGPVRIKMVSSRKGKLIRAEPIFALFEQAKAHLVGSDMGELEGQLCSWVPGSGRSPDRLDAFVHAAIELTGVGGGSLATPTGVIPRHRGPKGPGKGGHYKDLRTMMRGALHGR
jgi:phage terminase large subunit-like protein